MGRAARPGKSIETCPALLHDCRQLLAKRPAFFLMTCHSPGWGPPELQAALDSLLFGSCAAGSYAERLWLTTADGRRLRAGAAVRWPGGNGSRVGDPMTTQIIHSPHNPRFKLALKLRDHKARLRQRRFLIDGFAELQLACQSSLVLDELFICAARVSRSQRHSTLRQRIGTSWRSRLRTDRFALGSTGIWPSTRRSAGHRPYADGEAWRTCRCPTARWSSSWIASKNRETSEQ